MRNFYSLPTSSTQHSSQTHLQLQNLFSSLFISLFQPPRNLPWILNKDTTNIANPSHKIPRCNNSQTWPLPQTQKTLNASRENGAKISILHSSMRNTLAIVLQVVNIGRPILLVTNGMMILTPMPLPRGMKSWRKSFLASMTKVIWVSILTSTYPYPTSCRLFSPSSHRFLWF